jgi:hypothetical protein
VAKRILLVVIVGVMFVTFVLAILAMRDPDWFGVFFVSFIVMAFVASVPAGIEAADKCGCERNSTPAQDS